MKEELTNVTAGEVAGRDLYDWMGNLCGCEVWSIVDGCLARTTRFLKPVDGEEYYILIFNQNGLIVKELYSSGYFREYTYDERGSIIREVRSDGATEYNTEDLVLSPMQYEDGVDIYELRPKEFR